MEPTSDVNLMRFLSSYEAFGEYFLAPAVMRDRSSPPEFFLDQRLMKRELYVREAWKIGRNDVDAVAIKRRRRTNHSLRAGESSCTRVTSLEARVIT